MGDVLEFNAARRVQGSTANMEEVDGMISGEDDPNNYYSPSAMRSAWDQLSTSVLQLAFSTAKAELAEIVSSFMDETMGADLAASYFSHTSNMKLPYSCEEEWCPWMRKLMLEAFKKSPYYDMLIGGWGDVEAKRMVSDYLETSPMPAP